MASKGNGCGVILSDSLALMVAKPDLCHNSLFYSVSLHVASLMLVALLRNGKNAHCGSLLYETRHVVSVIAH